MNLYRRDFMIRRLYWIVLFKIRQGSYPSGRNEGYLFLSACQVEGFDDTGKPLERITKSEQLQAGSWSFRWQFCRQLESLEGMPVC